MRIRHKILAGYLALIAVAVVLVFLFLVTISDINRRYADLISRDQSILLQANNLRAGVQRQIVAARTYEVNPDLALLVEYNDAIHQQEEAISNITPLLTTEEDGNTLDGTTPEQFAPELERRGASVIGVNCAVGPAPMLETIERMEAVTRVPLSAQPNAGKPRDVEGRNIYLCSPEYMASYARRFVLHNVRVVGGCCGTTPEHIRQITIAVRGAASSTSPSASVSPSQQTMYRNRAGSNATVGRRASKAASPAGP